MRSFCSITIMEGRESTGALKIRMGGGNQYSSVGGVKRESFCLSHFLSEQPGELYSGRRNCPRVMCQMKHGASERGGDWMSTNQFHMLLHILGVTGNVGL